MSQAVATIHQPPDRQPSPRPGVRRESHAAAAAASDPWRAGLWLVLLLAAVFRFYGLAWDEWTLSHPDERHVQMSANKLAWPSSLSEFLDEARSPLNPRNRDVSYFAYGTLPTTLLTACAHAASITEPQQRTALGRGLSALADLGVVLLVFGLARTLYGERRLATLAAGLYAASVLPIQQAHFFVVDPFANLFSTLCLFLLAVAWRRDASGRTPAGSRFWAAAGVAWGLAIACKLSMASLAAPVGLAAIAGLWRMDAGSRFPRPAAAPAWWRTAGRLALFGLLGLLTVRFVEPDAFSGWVTLAPRWLANMREVTDISRGITDAPFTRQWVGRTPLLYPWENLTLWGLGPALGLAAWAGLGWAAWRTVRRGERAHGLLVIWTGALFLYYGVQWQMTLRYFLPIYGPLAVLAAWACVRAGQRLPRAARAVPMALVAGGTLVWALAYLHILGQPFTRADASRWVFTHVPAGSTLATEEWDDALPWPLPGSPGPETYHNLELPWYATENDEMREAVLAKLDAADYVILASDKLYGSIPRLPWRYPLAISYYQGLFDGSLGFDLAAEFRRPMRLFGRWDLQTDAAEEAFGVYDHPRVMIFRKNPARFSAVTLRARFAAIDLAKVVDARQPTGTPDSRHARVAQTKTEQDILLDPARWKEQQTAASGTWSVLFSRDSLVNRYPLAVWTLGLLGLLAAGFPWGFLLGRRALPDAGLGLARLAAWAVPTWAVWMLASLEWLPFRGGLWTALLAAFGVMGWALAASSSGRRAELAGFLRSEWPRLLAGEGVFWAGFALCLFIRSRNPDIWHVSWGGEKPMEMTYLYGVLKSDWFPPFNPWYAGGFINYYYFGFVLIAAPLKALGLLPAVGFNLALASLFGLTAGAAFTTCRALAGCGMQDAGCKMQDAEGEVATGSVRRPPSSIQHPVSSIQYSPLWPAFVGVALVLLLGNLFQGPFLWERLVNLGRPDHALTIPAVSDVIRAARGWEHVRAGQAPLTVYESDLYWCAARAIPVSDADGVPPVTEFPFWSFLYADLHPHVIALPFTFALLALLLAMLRGAAGDRAVPGSGAFRLGSNAVRLPALAFLLGMFWPTNTWDWPTYAGLTGLAMFLVCWRRDHRFAWAVGKAVALFVPTIALGYVLFLPFHRHQVSAYGSFERWRREGTTLTAYLVVHGLFLFLLVSAFAVGLRDRAATGPLRAMQCWLRMLQETLVPRRWRSAAGGRALGRALRERFRQQPAAAVGGWMLWMTIYALGCTAVMSPAARLPAMLGLGILLAGVLAAEHGGRGRTVPAFAWTLVLVGFALSLAVEFVVLVGDVGRMNTVFKFYYQVWTLFALASAALLPGVLRAWRGWSRRGQVAWAGALAILVAGAAVFPLTATPAKIADRFDRTQPPGLDGLAFLDRAASTYPVKGHEEPLRPDGAAIRWVQEHIAGSPVILEMNTGDTMYSWGSRFSIHTGLPSVVGWDWHQRQQQAGIRDIKVKERIDDVQTLYRTPDPELTRTLLKKYNVGLIVVSGLERAYGTPEGIAKFESLGNPVLYAKDGVTIYRVVPPIPPIPPSIHPALAAH